MILVDVISLIEHGNLGRILTFGYWHSQRDWHSDIQTDIRIFTLGFYADVHADILCILTFGYIISFLSCGNEGNIMHHVLLRLMQTLCCFLISLYTLDLIVFPSAIDLHSFFFSDGILESTHICSREIARMSEYPSDTIWMSVCGLSSFGYKCVLIQECSRKKKWV